MHSIRFSFVLVATAIPCIASAQPFDCDGVPTSAGEAITLELIASGISAPVDVTHAPGDTGRLFVVEQIGRIRIIDLSSGELISTPFLDIRSRVSYGGERGLLGMAFHPDYDQNGEFFVNYNARNGDTVVARYQVSGGSPDRANANSAEQVLSVDQPYSNHNGGQIQFSPRDGYLYIGMGDGGSGGDPGNRSQNTRNLLGKMLRIDVDSASPYGIPPDNPYVNNGSVQDEIWALGVRNPWRFSFDPLTHDLYIADVGQGTWEEIDFQPAGSSGGENYEWRVREGAHSYSGGTSYGPGERVGPVYEYRHSGGAVNGISISGGVVYRGCAIPDLHGRYFFADYARHWVRSFRMQNGVATGLVNHTSAFNSGISGNVRYPTAFGHDARGEVYLLDFQSGNGTQGRVYRIVSSNPPPNNPPIARITTDPSPPEVTLVDDSVQILLDGTPSETGGEADEELRYGWEKLAGPAGDIIGRPTKETTLVTFVEPGDYTYRLTVDDGTDTDTADVDVSILGGDSGTTFLRGDANIDGAADISDGTFILGTLFLGFQSPTCMDAMDTNDSGLIDLSDAVALFGYLFLGGDAPPAPGADACGVDPGDDDGLDCESFPPCA